jgi:hypothetical protein
MNGKTALSSRRTLFFPGWRKPSRLASCELKGLFEDVESALGGLTSDGQCGEKHEQVFFGRDEQAVVAAVTLVAGLGLTACTWMAKWFYGMPGRRGMDERLAPDFLQQMTRRYGIATLFQIAAVPVAIAAPRGVAITLLCVAFFLLPQPKPRYKPGEEPSAKEKVKE